MSTTSKRANREQAVLSAQAALETKAVRAQIADLRHRLGHLKIAGVWRLFGPDAR